MAKAKSPDKLYLQAESRTVMGKGVKYLRKGGKLPANVFGKNFSSLSITVAESDFRKIYSQAGQTSVVYLKVNGEEIPTLIGDIQKNHLKRWLLHIDFRKINLNQKIETAVPLRFSGEAPAENEGAVILYQMDEITVEALPTDIPSDITIDLSVLTETGQSITVADLPKSGNYRIVDDPELVIVSATEHKEQSTEADTAPTIPETEEGAAAEGEDAPAETTSEETADKS